MGTSTASFTCRSEEGESLGVGCSTNSGSKGRRRRIVEMAVAGSHASLASSRRRRPPIAPRTAAANVAAVRGAIGGRRLRLDANEAWDPATAISTIRLLLPFEPEFVEQPTPSTSPSSLRQVKEAVCVPIAADQAAFTPEDVYEICRRRAADLIVLGPHETGGLLAFTRAAAVAGAAGLNVCLHGQFVTGISDCAQHQAALAIPNLSDGNQIMHQLLQEDIISTPDIRPVHGRLGILDRPGLGFELDLDAVGRAAERYQARAS